MRFICRCFLIVAMLPLPAVAQQKTTDSDLWMVRSETITADLVKDSADLTSSERALLWARLAQRWWRDDREKAYSFMLKPVEIVEAIPNKENPDERRQRLATVRLLLKIVAPLDQKLSERMLAILTEAAEQDAKTGQGANADGLIEAATYLVDSNPKLAAELGVLALRVGHPTDITPLLWKLRGKDLKLANILFGQALATARQSLNPSLLNSLAGTVFPEYFTPGFTTTRPVATDDMRTELLKVYVAYLQANPINAENRASICISMVSFIVPLLAEFERHLPQQAVIVRQSINQCQFEGPLARQRVDDALQPLNTVDELLKAADDAKDMMVRTVYQFRAALLARNQNDWDRALKILDGMSTESREFSGGTWESYRWDWAATSALRHFKSGDFDGMRRVLNTVPINLQPGAKIVFLRQLPDDRDKDTDPTLEFLNDVRMGLRRDSLSAAEKSDGYFAMLPLTLKHQPGDAIAVLKDAIGALNRIEQAKDKNPGNEDRSFPPTAFAKALPASLLEMDEYAVKEAVASIASPYTRAQVRLELLGVCIQRTRAVKKRSPDTRPAVSKGQ